jgi:Berberine and berberine like
VASVLGGLIVHPRDQAGAVLRHYRDFMASAPDELTAYAGLICTPDGTPAVAVIVCYCGDPAEGARILKPLREFGAPLADAIQEMPFPVMQTILDDAFPAGTYNYWKSTFLSTMTDEAVDILVAHANKAASPMSAVVVEMYGGAAGRVGSDETAFAQRQAEFDVGIMAQWTDPGNADRHVGWARDLYDALQPYASGGYLLNFLDQEKPDLIRAAFGDNYARLVEVKNRYDPRNFFSLNQNITPTG